MTAIALGRDFVVYGLGEGMARAFSLVSIMILTSLLTPADYGLISLVLTVSAVFTILVGMGGEGPYARWFFDHDNVAEHTATTSTWLLGVGAVSLAAVAIAWPLTPWVGSLMTSDLRAPGFLLVGLAAIPFTLLNGICGQALRNRFMARTFIVLSLTTAVLGLALMLVFVVGLDMGAYGVLVAALVTAVVLFPIRLATIRDLLAPCFDRERFRAMRNFGFGLVASGLCYAVMNLADRWMIARFRGLDEVGYYSLAWNFASVMMMFVAAFGQAWSPHFFKALNTDPAGAPRLAARILTILMAAFGLLAIGLTVAVHPVMQGLIGSSFAPAVAAVGPLALGVVAYASTQVTAVGISIKKRSSLLFAAAAMAAIANVVLNLLLIPMAGFVGAAWATSLSYVFLSLLYTAMTQRLWPIPFEATRLAGILCVTVAGVLAATTLSLPAIWQGILATIGSGVAGAVVLAAVAGIPPKTMLTTARHILIKPSQVA